MLIKSSRATYSPSNTRYFLLLAIVTIAGFILRIYTLDKHGLWFDEGASYAFAASSAVEILTNTIETNPPFYHLILHFWINIFGSTEYSMRFPSVLFGTACIALIGQVGSVLFNRHIGIVSAVLMAFSVFTLNYSREARAYSLLLLLALGSYYFLVQAVKDNKRRDWALYLICSVLMCYTHYFAVFTLLAQNVYVLALPRHLGLLRQWCKIQCGVLLLFLPWLIVLLLQTHRLMEDGFWIEKPSADVTILRNFVSFYTHPYFVWVYIAVAIWGLLQMVKKNTLNTNCVEGALDGTPNPKKYSALPEIKAPELKTYWLLALWLLCPIAIPWLISQWSTPILHPRYTIVASAAFFLLISYGFWSIRGVAIKSVLSLVFAYVTLVSLQYYHMLPQVHVPYWNVYSGYPVDSYRETIARLKGELTRVDALIVSPRGSHWVFDYYNRGQIDYRVSPETSRDGNDEEFARALNEITQGKRRAWIVHRGGNEIIPAVRYFQSRYRLIEYRTYPEGSSLGTWVFDLTAPIPDPKITAAS